MAAEIDHDVKSPILDVRLTQNANARGQRQHQSNHHTSEVRGENGVQNDENTFVIQFLDAKPGAHGEKANQQVQIFKEKKRSLLFFSFLCGFSYRRRTTSRWSVDVH